jgi:uncharacterized membrane protein YhaH (DUF805 family)
MDDRYVDNRVSPRLAFRAVAHSFRFHGRSTRSEVISFWFFGMLTNLLVHFGDMSPPAPPSLTPAGIANLAWSIALLWPLIPLLVRRLHDQSRSWHWALFWPALLSADIILLMLPDSANGDGMSISLLTFHRSFAWSALATPLLVGSMLAGLAIFVLYFLSETPADNRYGPDPRVVPANETAILAAN